MSSSDDEQRDDLASSEPELLFTQDFDGQKLFVSRLDVGKRISRWKKLKKEKRKKKRAEETLRAFQNGETESQPSEKHNPDQHFIIENFEETQRKNTVNSAVDEENIEGAAFFYGLPSTFATSKHISRTSSSSRKKRRYSSRSNSLESAEEEIDQNNDEEQLEPPQAAESAVTTDAGLENYQWKSWDEYFAYFYGCYGRYPTEQELQQFMTQSTEPVAQPNSHIVFEEEIASKAQEEGESLVNPPSKRKNRKKRKREPPPTQEVTEEQVNGEDDEQYGDYYEEEQYDDDSYQPPVSKTNLKYWYQRYSLFSKWDEGIELDEEGWFSVTPESIARHIAAKCRKALLPPGTTKGRAPGIVVDAMCGPGGNSIQFASRFGLTLACDIDPNKIRLAKNNATVYGVQNDIDFIIGDFTRVCRGIKADAVFLSPPWGGPQYITQDKFDIHSMTPDGFDLFNMSSRVSKNIAYLLPRNTDPMQMLQLAGSNEACEIEQNYINGKFKTITAYYGKFVDLSKPSLKPEGEEETEQAASSTAEAK